MPKSFSKTGLKVGDKIKIPLHTNSFNVIDVGENGFVFTYEYVYASDLYETFEKAVKEGWTILEDESEQNVKKETEELCEECSLPAYFCNELQEIVYTDNTRERSTLARELRKKYKLYYDKSMCAKETNTQSIIKNNNELIEEMKECLHADSSMTVWDSGVHHCIKAIQSKNDLLSKE